jgi:hypothetical protein
MKKPRRPKPVVVAERQVTLRDFMIFQLKLALDGLKDVVVFQVSIVAMVVDFFSGRGKKPRWFYSVVRASERFDRWLDLYGAVQKIDAGQTDDGFFGASEAGSDSLLGELEQMVRGGDLPRKQRSATERAAAGDDRGPATRG